MTPRREILNEAADLIDGDRNDVYGDPIEDFSRIARYWSILFGVEVTPEQVAQAMILMKVSRLEVGVAKRDTWVDIAGYAGCGWDVVMSGVADEVKAWRQSAEGDPGDVHGL